MIHILVRAFEVEGGYSLTEFFRRLFSSKVWGLGCLIGPRSCGGRDQLVVPRRDDWLGDDHPWPHLRADLHTHRFSRQEIPVRVDSAANHHTAFRHRPRADPSFGRAGTATEFLADMLGWEKTRWSWAAATTCCRPRFSLPSSARSQTPPRRRSLQFRSYP